jgi:hypothetical protein
MPAIDQYAVDITVQVREGTHASPDAAIEAACALLGIPGSLIITASVSLRPAGTSSQYTVELSTRIRDGFHEGPAEAVQAAIKALDIDPGAIVYARAERHQ